ncbi:hypothetical protein [Alteromonas aestuariivivens]|uniref:hypothetical protein n=1 Tax=Alteromonas aestuariivivens TaxID=1938339 RepID=UPI0015F28876|nr:hypothetical protein [Alteromonas aestuariivivens]
MLKAYAVALVLSTTAPVADKQEGVKNASEKPQQASTQPQVVKPGRGGSTGGIAF